MRIFEEKKTLRAACLGLGLAAAVAAAGAARADIPLGCYERQYSAEHVAKHPAQIVDYVKLWIYPWPEYNQINATMQARFLNQGRIKGRKVAGRTLDQVLTCWEFNGGPGCGVDCDGGSFTFVKQSDTSITIETEYLTIGEADGCGGAESLAEVPGQPVRYRLNRVADAACAGMDWE